eukprot:PhF_6_TR26691/c1_g1_i3/m.38909
MAGGLIGLFKSGDVVVTNPWETMTIFLFVVALSVGLEHLFHGWKHSSKHTARALYANVSVHMWVTGVVSLVTLTVGSIVLEVAPQDYYTLFEWTRVVLFLMICFYAGGICLAAGRVWKLFKEWDAISEQDLGWVAKTWNQHLFFNAREVFYYQLGVLFKMKHAKDDISFSKYMRIVIWDAVVVLTDL